MEVISAIVDKLEEPKLKPLHFIRKSATETSDTQNLIADVFKLILSRSGSANNRKNEMLQEIFIRDFDLEQVWQQIELKNKSLKCYVPVITRLLLSRNELSFPYCKKGELAAISPVINSSKDKNSALPTVDSEESSLEEESSQDEEMDTDFPNIEGGNTDAEKCGVISDHQEDSVVVDRATSSSKDLFFNLNDMEYFLEEAEKKSLNGDDVDYFTDIPSGDEDDSPQPMYNDFFEDPQSVNKSSRIEKGEEEDSSLSDDNSVDEVMSSKKRNKKHFEEPDEIPNSKKVRFMSEDESSSEESEKSDSIEKSSFEKKNSKLKEKIAKLEESALSEKPWPQRGEVDALQRPVNSLLEEIVDVDLTSRPAPVITEKVTNSLETVIINRIKDRAFDDVEKKIKPVHVQHELKKELVLNQEKSKFSLAQIYEQEFMKKQEVNNDQESPENSEMTEQKEEILKMMKSVFKKLDTLSNFHFTPKPVTDELKIISNAPAISLEETLPTAVSEGSTLAPQEISGSKKKVLIGKDERTKTDKQRERRKKKAFMARKLKKSKNAGASLAKILKSKKVSLVEPAGKEKGIQTSTKFFTQLQEKAEAGFLTRKPKEKSVKPKPHK